MTDAVMTSRGLPDRSADTDLPRDMIGLAAVRPRALEVGARTAAGYGEKTAGRPIPPSCTPPSRWSGATARSNAAPMGSSSSATRLPWPDGSASSCRSGYGGSSDSCLHPLPIHILDPGEPDGAAELRARMPEDVAGGSLRKPGVLQLVADEDGVGA